MENIELLKGKVRAYDPKKDKCLPTFSYSKLDTSDKCPYQYNIKYNLKNYAPQESIALDLGTTCHKILEMKARMIIEGKEVDYELLHNVLHKGMVEKTDKGEEVILGIEDIKKKFGFETWFEPDNASGMNYEEKIEKFEKEVVPSRFNEDKEWTPYAAEMQFDFVYNYGEEVTKEVHIHGFIDSVLGKNYKEIDGEIIPTEFKVVDYKTSKKVYDSRQTVTSLQQFIYGLAVYVAWFKLPVSYEYDFLLINARNVANTNGYLKRGLKKLDKLLKNIDEMWISSEWKPSPTPLCFYCSFCANNPSAVSPYNSLCEYYSLWKPNQKSFSVNKDWIPSSGSNPIPFSTGSTSTTTKRKLVF